MIEGTFNTENVIVNFFLKYFVQRNYVATSRWCGGWILFLIVALSGCVGR